MKHSAAFPLLAVLAGFSFAPQLQAQDWNAIAMQGSGCPVSFRALHAADGSMVSVRKPRGGTSPEGSPRSVSQSLHLIITNPRFGQITSARVTLFGLSGKGHMAQAGRDASFDVLRTQEVRFPAVTGKEVATELWIPGMTSVQVVRLDSVTYADGSTWKMEASDTCRITPELLMLVDR